MKLIRLQAENIKKLRAVEIAPKGNVVRVVGQNGAGKTSVLDSIMWALGGADGVDEQPIRQGETTATIRADLGDLVVRRTFTEGGGTRLVVESADGLRYPSPQKVLDGLLGAISFDPLAFTRATPKEQLDTLRSLVTLDVDIDALDVANARDYAERTDYNRRAKALAERVATLAERVDVAMDTTLIDVSALSDQMAQASAHNASIAEAKRRMADNERRRAAIGCECQEIKDEIRRLQERFDALNKEDSELFEAALAEPDLAEPIDVTALQHEIKVALHENAVREQQERQRAAHHQAVNELAGAQVMAEELTMRMDDRAKLKAEAIAAAAMPVPGLSFGDGKVLFNSRPLSQASAAEQLRVSLAIAIAMNPKLRVALIRDASLLDERSMAIVREMAETHDVQVWMEVVGDDSACGVLIEDGAVVEVDGVPVDHASDAPALAQTA